MSKQNIKFWAYGGVVLFLAAILLVFVNMNGATAQDAPATETLGIETATHSCLTYRVALATTPQQMETGLMYRDHIDEDYGMLFVYPHPAEMAMWMHNTRIPLDMLFMDEKGMIVTLHKNAKPYDDTPIPSGQPVKAVLEIKGGQVALKGIQVGDHVLHPVFGTH